MGAIQILAYHLRLLIGAEHKRDVWTVDVAVEQSDLEAHFAKGNCQIDGERGFADSTLARTDGDDGVDAG